MFSKKSLVYGKILTTPHINLRLKHQPEGLRPEDWYWSRVDMGYNKDFKMYCRFYCKFEQIHCKSFSFHVKNSLLNQLTRTMKVIIVEISFSFQHSNPLWATQKIIILPYSISIIKIKLFIWSTQNNLSMLKFNYACLNWYNQYFLQYVTSSKILTHSE